VNHLAVKAAGEFGIDISRATPSAYDSLPSDLDLLISVCDRANEAIVPDSRQRLHWSIADPVRVGTLTAFRAAFADIAGRMRRVAGEGLA
jgi:protein-tyrosine-phosphatase